MSHQTPISIALPFNHLKWKWPSWDSFSKFEITNEITAFCSHDFNCIERVLSVTGNKIKDLIIRGNIWRANVKELLCMTHTLLRLQSGRHDDLESKKPPGWECIWGETYFQGQACHTPLGSFQIIQFYFSKPCPLYIMITWYNIDTMIPAMRV